VGTSKTRIESAPAKSQASRITERVTPAPEPHCGPAPVRRVTSALPAPNGAPSAPRTGNIARASEEFPRAHKRSAATQRQIGNTRMANILSHVQAKIAVGEPGDRYEREADEVASRVASGQKVGRILRIVSASAPPLGSKEKDATMLLRENRTEETTKRADWARFAQLQSGPSAGGYIESPEMERALTAPGAGRPLPDGMRAQMERGLGDDFSTVRVHDTAADHDAAESLNAKAFAYREHVWLGPAGSTNDSKLMAHELTHVIQQRGSLPPAEDPEPSESAQEHGRTPHPVAEPKRGRPEQGAMSGLYGVRASAQREVAAIETPAVTVQLKVAARPVKKRAVQGPIQRQSKDKKNWVPFKIRVERKMTQEEFKVAAMGQVFGAVREGLTWYELKDEYLPEKSPYRIWVEPQLLEAQRGRAREERGISVGERGGITGAKERAKTFHTGPETDLKSALLKEIDRRYFETVGDEAETKIKPGEKGKAKLWRMIRDEVLFQHEYIANLPPKVKELVKLSLKGRDLAPADYDKLFAIAKKIEKMPVGQVSDYASKVTGTTMDLGGFAASLDRYIAEMAARGLQSAGREKVHNKLIGLEAVYEQYKLWKTLLMTASMSSGLAHGGGSPQSAGAGLQTALQAGKMQQELETQLQAHGFKGIDDFSAWIARYEAAFEQEAANIAKDILAKYAGKLYRESEHYKNQDEARDLHRGLSGFRASYAELEPNARIWNDYVRAQQKASEQSRIPGQGHVKTSDYTSTTAAEAEAARKKALEAKASAQTQFKGLSGDHPVFEEEGLPDEKKIDKVALARASETQLGGLLQAQIQRRMKDVEEAKDQIDKKPELIYKMDELMPQFYAQQGIRPGSIHYKIIQDKMRSDAIVKIVKGLAIALVAVALAAITFGAATPAIVAAGAAIFVAGLSGYQAYESYQEYVEEKKLADVGFAKDPSVVWLVIAIAGAALDMAAAVRAVNALGAAAKALDAGGDLADFTKLVRALEREKRITSEIARASEKAATARKGFAEASAEYAKATAVKMYGFPGPLVDLDVYPSVVKMAREAIKAKIGDAQKFIEEIKLARVRAKLRDLTLEDLAQVKQAWEEAKLMEAAEAAIETAERARVGTYTTKIKWGVQTIDARPHTTIKGAFWGRRTPQSNVRANAYELKINPNNESFFLPHPSGGYVQFEQLVGTGLVQDGKCVVQSRSIYHVADMEQFTKSTFAANQVLAEARRQVAAASAAGMRTEWLISEARALQQVEALFQKEGIAITLRLVPE
jgi:hypothetical protein